MHAVKQGGGDVGRSSPVVLPPAHDSQFTDEIVSYGCSAVQGFFRSIALSVESSLQDTLRYMNVDMCMCSSKIYRTNNYAL